MQAHDALDRTEWPGRPLSSDPGTSRVPGRASLIVAATALLLAAAAFGLEILMHRHRLLTWFDVHDTVDEAITGAGRRRRSARNRP